MAASHSLNYVKTRSISGDVSPMKPVFSGSFGLDLKNRIFILINDCANSNLSDYSILPHGVLGFWGFGVLRFAPFSPALGSDYVG